MTRQSGGNASICSRGWARDRRRILGPIMLDLRLVPSRRRAAEAGDDGFCAQIWPISRGFCRFFEIFSRFTGCFFILV
jgi:hypothetical protein